MKQISVTSGCGMTSSVSIRVEQGLGEYPLENVWIPIVGGITSRWWWWLWKSALITGWMDGNTWETEMQTAILWIWRRWYLGRKSDVDETTLTLSNFSSIPYKQIYKTSHGNADTDSFTLLSTFCEEKQLKWLRVEVVPLSWQSWWLKTTFDPPKARNLWQKGAPKAEQQ